MRILVAYYTQTSNTQKIARALYDEVVSLGHDADLKAIDASMPESFREYDLVFLGSACHSSDLARPVKALLDALTPSPPFKLAGFATHSAPLPEGDPWQSEMYEKWAGTCVKSFEQACQAKGIPWCGYFSCQGAASPDIEVFIHQTIVPDDKAWADYAAEMRKHPDADDREKARAFARHVLLCTA